MDVDITGDAIVTCRLPGPVQLSHRCSARAPSSKEQAARSPSHSGFAVLYGGEALGIFLANGLDATNSLNTTPYAAMATAGLAMVCAYETVLFTERDFSALSRVVDAAVDNTEDVKGHRPGCGAFGARNRGALTLHCAAAPTRESRRNCSSRKSTADTHLRRIYSNAACTAAKSCSTWQKNRRQPAIARIGAAHGNTRKNERKRPSDALMAPKQKRRNSWPISCARR